MKTYNSLNLGLAYGLVFLLLFTSCETQEIDEPSVLVEEEEIIGNVDEFDPTLRVNNSILFPITARMFGKSIEDWAIELGKASVSFDCETILKPHMLILSDKVVAPYGSIEDSSDEYTITKDQFMFLSPAFFLNNYPCPPEEEWEPAEGQSLENFLKEYASFMINSIETLEVYFDGIAIEELSKYRISSKLFYFTGNPVLAECYDTCITGTPQPGLVDGYFMMFKNMKKGKHTIMIKGDIPSQDFSFEMTINLNVVN